MKAIPRPTLEAPDLMAILALAIVYSAIGVFSLSSVDRGLWFAWGEPVAGGLALGAGTAGIAVWWRRRVAPALAQEAVAWAVLGVTLPVAFLAGFFQSSVGDFLLGLGGCTAFVVSFLGGAQVTPLVAVGRFGGIAAVGFAIYDLLLVKR